jgi:hypothetical protein
MADRLEQMIAAQQGFQAKLGHKFAAMTPEERIMYMKEMYIAAIAELGEALDETSWKPWAHGYRFNSAGVVSELSDAWQFMANMWFVAMPTGSPADIAEGMYHTLMNKLEVNHTRADNGYDNTDKCPACRRAYDDTHVTCVRKAHAQHEGTNDVPAFCDISRTYVSDNGEALGFGASGWYVVTP